MSNNKIIYLGLSLTVIGFFSFQPTIDIEISIIISLIGIIILLLELYLSDKLFKPTKELKGN